MAGQVVHRQHSKVRVTLHSHYQDNMIDMSDDVTYVQTQKTTKSIGRFQIHLAPRRNYLNYIFANDIINVYFNPNDGKRGNIRSMMGYVDSVNIEEKTDDNSVTTTKFVIIGSDFQKAFDKSSIYFNAYMRQLLDERFARTDQGKLRGTFNNSAEGAALRNAGLTVFGSPSDFIENFSNTLLGFGGQWRLPDSYAKSQGRIDANRKKRIQRAKDRLPENLTQLLETIGLSGDVESLSIQKIIDKAKEVLRELSEAEKVVGELKKKQDAAHQLTSNLLLSAYRAVVQTTEAGYPIGIIDLLSFDFIEALAVDGFNQDASIWGSQGTISQFLYGNSNGIINELMFDLRPVSVGNEGIKEGDYDKTSDELGINMEGPGPAEVQYAPSIIFREYPYSVVSGFDASKINFTPTGQASYSKTDAGFVPFGPVFSMEPNVQKRHVYEYNQPLIVTDCRFSRHQKPLKHLDSITIRNTDVKEVSVGRSDDQVINAITLNSKHTSQISESTTSIMSNFMPILNQISIARHGFRLWQGTTPFAAAGPKDACEVGAATDTNEERRRLVRWQLLLDHWYQHNVEYLSGTVKLRFMPEIRVGYRLDWEDRNISYYVEGVTQTWERESLTAETSVQLTRGQRNDPYPAYVPPIFLDDSSEVIIGSSGDRSKFGRLAKNFLIKDTKATVASTGRKDPPHLARNIVDLRENITHSGAVVFPDGISLEKVQRSGDIGVIDALDSPIETGPRGVDEGDSE